ncbi:ArsR/SmtB family transcription factor [Peribacillus tepidiphilus]|uniref:ArsR/SmtB family transcription factor n=1 Tax=Peribacillus tepidiphilus TaxID=2652445 RepID=UPI001CDC23AD|nr:metalloregulator ArsR/SmtB family transcription factor [Peribacillus tepidiphilus]
MSNDRCEIYCFDEEKVMRVKGSFHMEEISNMTKLFKALADETRMKIAIALLKEQELCVCDVANIIDSTVATASHHLRFLNNIGVAKKRKEGKLIFYSLDNEYIKKFLLLALDYSKELV